MGLFNRLATKLLPLKMYLEDMFSSKHICPAVSHKEEDKVL